jgi:hypothetical protein
MSVLELSPAALAAVAPAVEALAAAEGLEAHARAVRVRLKMASAGPERSAAKGRAKSKGRGSRALRQGSGQASTPARGRAPTLSVNGRPSANRKLGANGKRKVAR